MCLHNQFTKPLSKIFLEIWRIVWEVFYLFLLQESSKNCQIEIVHNWKSYILIFLFFWKISWPTNYLQTYNVTIYSNRFNGFYHYWWRESENTKVLYNFVFNHMQELFAVITFLKYLLFKVGTFRFKAS